MGKESALEEDALEEGCVERVDDTAGAVDYTDEAEQPPLSKTQQEKEHKRRARASIVVKHVDIIKNTFWTRHPWILQGRAPK